MSLKTRDSEHVKSPAGQLLMPQAVGSCGRRLLAVSLDATSWDQKLPVVTFDCICIQSAGPDVACGNRLVPHRCCWSQVRKLAPNHMQTSEPRCTARHHITCANFSCQGEIVASYHDEVNSAAAAKFSCLELACTMLPQRHVWL